MPKLNRLHIIIAVLTFFLILVIVGLIAQSMVQKTQTSPQKEIDFIDPTGILIPTRKVSPNELDIVKISPQDMQKNIGPQEEIVITFSRSFSADEIKFYISPDTLTNVEIKENILHVTPVKAWSPGTKYSYSVNFINDRTKVRLYTFQTTGPTSSSLPDTAPQDAFQEELERQKTIRPDIYVSNQTPYENAYFSISAEYTTDSPARFYFSVKQKVNNTDTVKQYVNAWLQSLDLTQDQISNLDIRY